MSSHLHLQRDPTYEPKLWLTSVEIVDIFHKVYKLIQIVSHIAHWWNYMQQHLLIDTFCFQRFQLYELFFIKSDDQLITYES